MKNDLYYLFKVNENFDLTEVNNDYIIIDNFYKNYEDLNKFITVLKKDIRPNSISDERYNNYRTVINKQLDVIIISLLKKYSKDIFNYEIEIIDKEIITINSLSLNTNIDMYLQHWPHVDPGPTVLIYLDKIGYNGTVVYKDTYDKNNIIFKPLLGYFRDTSKLNIKVKIPSKPNRLVILKATQLHGAYYEDYSKFIGNERIHQIVFSKVVK